ncbi:MAG: 6-phosphofructokinase [Phycisphaeraceae bacterium]|nr:6-phosphofructokinase [Phycisphaeraceae bacterium]MCW5754548.1 6-phosphofructokinase [Phycisphaeraceae bacterium]
MPKTIRRLGVLTGGGDCPGLNAVIRAVTKDAIYHGMEVLGIEDGFLGLIENRIRPLCYDDVSNILTQGGTILGSSNKANPIRFAVGRNPDGTPIFKDVTSDCLRHIEQHGIDALVVIGGDGTMACAAPFIDHGICTVGVPKTIDNDLWGTDLTFGFMTAVQTATDAIDKVHTTAASHHRAMVVEVMGRNAGWIALHAGVASGADVILLPENPFDLDKVCHTVERRGKRGRRFTIICCAEGAYPRDGEKVVERVDPTSPDPIRLGGVSKWLAGAIEARTGVESRYVVLGHVQRGGSPVAEDRVLATLFGDHAMDLLKEGRVNRLVAWQNGRLTDVDLRESAGRQRLVPDGHPIVEAARSVGTDFGD